MEGGRAEQGRREKGVGLQLGVDREAERERHRETRRETQGERWRATGEGHWGTDGAWMAWEGLSLEETPSAASSVLLHWFLGSSSAKEGEPQ